MLPKFLQLLIDAHGSDVPLVSLYLFTPFTRSIHQFTRHNPTPLLHSPLQCAKVPSAETLRVASAQPLKNSRRCQYLIHIRPQQRLLSSVHTPANGSGLVLCLLLSFFLSDGNGTRFQFRTDFSLMSAACCVLPFISCCLINTTCRSVSNLPAPSGRYCPTATGKFYCRERQK